MPVHTPERHLSTGSEEVSGSIPLGSTKSRINTPRWRVFDLADYARSDEMGRSARRGSKIPEYGIEIYRCDLLHRIIFGSKFNQNFNIPLGSTKSSINTPRWRVFDLADYARSDEMGRSARRGSKIPEYGIEIYRCDLLHRIFFGSKFNQNFNIPLGSNSLSNDKRQMCR